MGEILKGTSLHALLEQCNEFKHELSTLQILGQEIGVAVDATPKYHAELAGEGIEYSWGYSKSVYRHSPLSSKKGRQKNFELVDRCCDPVIHLKKEQVRKMAKRARSYICTYHYLATQNDLADVEQPADQPVVVADDAPRCRHKNENKLAEKQKQLFVNIEKLTKKFWTHQCALDFDGSFVNSLFNITSQVKKRKRKKISDDETDEL